MVTHEERARWLKLAIERIEFQSGDGLNLAQDALDRACVPLPELEELRTVWKASMKNKADRALSEQVRTKRRDVIQLIRALIASPPA